MLRMKTWLERLHVGRERYSTGKPLLNSNISDFNFDVSEFKMKILKLICRNQVSLNLARKPEGPYPHLKELVTLEEMNNVTSASMKV